MTRVIDATGREFQFNQIRFKMNEALLQQASLDVRGARARERAQLLFDRYCVLHLQKYRRHFEPAHFSNGRVRREYERLYDNPTPAISITIDITSGALFDRYIGLPIEEIEAAIRRDPGGWVRAGRVVAIER